MGWGMNHTTKNIQRIYASHKDMIEPILLQTGARTGTVDNEKAKNTEKLLYNINLTERLTPMGVSFSFSLWVLICH